MYNRKRAVYYYWTNRFIRGFQRWQGVGKGFIKPECFMMIRRPHTVGFTAR